MMMTMMMTTMTMMTRTTTMMMKITCWAPPPAAALYLRALPVTSHFHPVGKKSHPVEKNVHPVGKKFSSCGNQAIVFRGNLSIVAHWWEVVNNAGLWKSSLLCLLFVAYYVQFIPHTISEQKCKHWTCEVDKYFMSGMEGGGQSLTGWHHALPRCPAIAKRKSEIDIEFSLGIIKCSLNIQAKLSEK